jgi:hypothetical protein
MSIQELIQKNKSERDEKFEYVYSLSKVDRITEVFKLLKDWDTQYTKDLIDAVIENEEKAKKDLILFGKFGVDIEDIQIKEWNASKKDTISKLKAIKELL